MATSLARSTLDSAASTAEDALDAVQDLSETVGRHPGRVLVGLLVGSAVAWLVALAVAARVQRSREQEQEQEQEQEEGAGAEDEGSTGS
ncbi:hypothetical protein GCM10027047_12420 [Rhodococcus aerolatus]